MKLKGEEMNVKKNAIEEILQHIREKSQKGKILIRLNKFCSILGNRETRDRIEEQLDIPFNWGYYATVSGGRKDGWYIKFRGGKN